MSFILPRSVYTFRSSRPFNAELRLHEVLPVPAQQKKYRPSEEAWVVERGDLELDAYTDSWALN